MAVLSVDDAKQHLNITTDVDDAELSDVIDSAEAAIASRVGPLEAATYTRRVAGGGATLLLPHAPVSSITGISPADGDVFDTTLVYLNVDAGAIELNSYGLFPERFYDVTYVAGYSDDMPADLMLALKELVRHLWDPQRGGARRPGGPPPEAAAPGYLIPNRVAELIEPYRIPGIA